MLKVPLGPEYFGPSNSSLQTSGEVANSRYAVLTHTQCASTNKHTKNKQHRKHQTENIKCTNHNTANKEILPSNRQKEPNHWSTSFNWMQFQTIPLKSPQTARSRSNSMTCLEHHSANPSTLLGFFQNRQIQSMTCDLNTQWHGQRTQKTKNNESHRIINIRESSNGIWTQGPATSSWRMTINKLIPSRKVYVPLDSTLINTLVLWIYVPSTTSNLHLLRWRLEGWMDCAWAIATGPE